MRRKVAARPFSSLPTTVRIGLEVGRSYTLTSGPDQTIVTALSSPWAESRIAELETVLRDIAMLATQQVAGADDPLLTIERLARNALSRQERRC